jgi:DNA-binding CsgD family transcriptional regulator
MMNAALRLALDAKGLSNRESEVVELIITGLSNKEVATKLFVTEKTVKFHLTNIYKKTSVKSRTMLTARFLPFTIDGAAACPVMAEPAVELPVSAPAQDGLPVGKAA